MARINIEDSLWADDRFLVLVEKTGNRASAIGAVMIAFKTAQRFWVPDERPIPAVQFRSIPFAADLLSCGLAEEVENGDFVYIKGTKNQFAWLLQHSKAGRGNKGKKLKRRETAVVGDERHMNGREPLTLPPPLTLPLSPVLTQKKEKEKNENLRNSLSVCSRTWIETLGHFKIQRPLNASEETEIIRAIQRWSVEYVDTALYGARFEPKNKDFDPKDHISLGRVLNKDRIEKFVNLGTREKNVFASKHTETQDPYDLALEEAERVMRATHAGY